jgi:hypothetical protein
MLTSSFRNVLLLTAGLPLSTAQHVIDLSGNGWTVKNSEGNVHDNSFLLVPGKPKAIGFAVQEDTSNGAWAKAVTVGSIWDQGQSE